MAPGRNQSPRQAGLHPYRLPRKHPPRPRQTARRLLESRQESLAPLLQKSSRARPGKTPDRQRDTFLVTRYRYIVTAYGN